LRQKQHRRRHRCAAAVAWSKAMLSTPPQHPQDERRHPLDDDDRAGWLVRLGEELQAIIKAGERPILTCSALKRRYRETLRQAVPELGFVFLELTPQEAEKRVLARPGHFMPASLIDSQFAALESPAASP
jgi:gluconokinase